MYKHGVKESRNPVTEEIIALKEEVARLKVENDIKINILVKVHLQELNDLKVEKHQILQDVNSEKELLSATLASKEEDLEQARQKI